MRLDTRERFIEKLQSDAIMPFIKARITTTLAELPKTGIIAGQAVSSAIIEFLSLDGIINPIYNDLDNFVVLNREILNTDNPNAKKILELMAQRTVVETSTFNEKYTTLDMYGHIFRGVMDKEKVLLSIDMGNVNKTFLASADPLRFKNSPTIIRRVIQNFDINSTQVGFYSDENKLYFTSAFVDFLITKELEIVKFNTPMQSIIRLEKKGKELGGVFINKEEQNFLVMAQSHLGTIQKKLLDKYKEEKKIDKDNAEISAFYNLSIPLSFGVKHQNTFHEYSMDNNWTMYETDGGLHSLGIDHSISEKYIDRLFSFTGSNIISPSDKEVLACAFTEDYSSFKGGKLSIHKASSTIQASVETFKKIKHLRMSIVKMVHKLEDEELGYLVELLPFLNSANGKISLSKKYVGRDYIDAIANESAQTLDRLRKIGKHILRHNINLTINIGMNCKNLLEFVSAFERVFRIEKRTGFFLGFIETSPEFAKASYLSENRCLEILEHIEITYSSQLKDKKLVCENEHYYINECTTGKELIAEGKRQHHCVGGYGKAIKDNGSLVFSFRSKEKKSGFHPDITIELHESFFSYTPKRFSSKVFNFLIPKNKKRYEIRQVATRFNAKVSYTESLHLTLKRVNKEYPLYFKNSHYFLDVPEDFITTKDTLFMEENDSLTERYKIFLKVVSRLNESGERFLGKSRFNKIKKFLHIMDDFDIAF